MDKYYLYISDSKLDALLGPALDRTADREARLKRVLQTLREADQMGTVASGSRYIEATLEMSYRAYEGIPEPHGVGVGEGTAAVFAGESAGICLVMVGSSTHMLLGAPAAPSRMRARSDLPDIVNLLDSVRWMGYGSDSDASAATRVRANARRCLAQLERDMPAVPVEFVARRLWPAPGEVFEGDTVIASPLYVSLP